jgi:thiosulfate dehydrogenase [quinone] large subunit
MTRADYFSSFAWLCVRVVLALLLIFAVIGIFQAPIPPEATNKPWIGPNAPTVIPGLLYALIFLSCALLLLAGWNVPIGVIALSSMLIVVSVERLIRNPFTNLTADVVLILVLGLALLLAGPEADRWSVDARRGTKPLAPEIRYSWATLFFRLLIGAIFFFQGFRNLFLGAGPLVFAERLYVKPFAAMMPEPLLWIAGVTNPFVQFGVGLLLIVGLFTRFAAGFGALFLVSIIFGHLMQAPLTAPGAMRDFATANFMLMIAVLVFASWGNRWSLDALLVMRRRPS